MPLHAHFGQNAAPSRPNRGALQSLRQFLFLLDRDSTGHPTFRCCCATRGRGPAGALRVGTRVKQTVAVSTCQKVILRQNCYYPYQPSTGRRGEKKSRLLSLMLHATATEVNESYGEQGMLD